MNRSRSSGTNLRRRYVAGFLFFRQQKKAKNFNTQTRNDNDRMHKRGFKKSSIFFLLFSQNPFSSSQCFTAAVEAETAKRVQGELNEQVRQQQIDRAAQERLAEELFREKEQRDQAEKALKLKEDQFSGELQMKARQLEMHQDSYQAVCPCLRKLQKGWRRNENGPNFWRNTTQLIHRKSFLIFVPKNPVRSTGRSPRGEKYFFSLTL